MDSHHEPSPSHGDVQFSYTLGAGNLVDGGELMVDWARTAPLLSTIHSPPFTKLAPAAGIAPASPPLQGGANLPQLHGVFEVGSRNADVGVGMADIPLLSLLRPSGFRLRTSQSGPSAR